MTSAVSVTDYLRGLRAEIDAALERVVPPAVPKVIAEPVRYALLGAGKRLRPCLTLAAAERVGARAGLDEGAARQLAMPAACAIEMIHTYSLVHDDLPAMDNDALRRGRPTTHVVFGDGLAILTGDGLLTEAFSVLTADDPAPPSPVAAETWDRRRLRAVQTLAAAAGVAGMVGGQAIDLVYAGQAAGPVGQAAGPVDFAAGPAYFNRRALEDMHLRKTGALIRAAATLGAIMAGADATLVAAVDEYARELGLAFQIVDDVLDVEGSAAALGKTAGKDAAAAKPTFPALYGLEQSKRLAAACVERAKETLARSDLDGRLSEIADWSLARTN